MFGEAQVQCGCAQALYIKINIVSYFFISFLFYNQCIQIFKITFVQKTEIDPLIENKQVVANRKKAGGWTKWVKGSAFQLWNE